MYKKRYFLTFMNVEKEVTEEEFIQAERAAGFWPKPGCGPVATGGFGGGGISGRVMYESDNSEAK